MSEPISAAAQGARYRGLDLADYAQRTIDDEGYKLRGLWRAVRSRLTPAAATRLPTGVTRVLDRERKRLELLDDAALQHEIELRRGYLARGRHHAPANARLRAEAHSVALALVATVMSRKLGMSPYATQFHAAWLMLNGRLVEMATGEGKTLTAALAASVAALGGLPVHVLTANDYLVERDRESMTTLYDALGLSSSCVLGSTPGSARSLAWQHDIVYATARELVFDYLRDHILFRGERDPRMLRAQAIEAQEAGLKLESATVRPMLPGLFFCLIDEADSILLDEAVLPLVLAEAAPALDEGAYRRVYELTCTLQRQRDYSLMSARRAVLLSDEGRARVSAAVKNAGGVLSPPRRACELAEAALAARLMYHRDREYVVGSGQIMLIDELTGRIAEGRQWQGALQPMVEIKEGLALSAPTGTVAQITYQQFFPRYIQLCGMSGTLAEARHELYEVYASTVTRVPLARKDRRIWLGRLCFVDAKYKWKSVLERVRDCSLAGRPVLVGTDSVSDSAHLSSLLSASGIAHQLLNAVQDADEAEHIAGAGHAGVVTIATNIAGRGTDIKLDDAAAAAGGLHVIATMCNRSRRIDRQLFGRVARHGDPGSAEVLLALDDEILLRLWPAAFLRMMGLFSRKGQVPGWLVWPLFWVAQHVNEWRDRYQRRELRHADRRIKERYGFSGGAE